MIGGSSKLPSRTLAEQTVGWLPGWSNWNSRGISPYAQGLGWNHRISALHPHSPALKLHRIFVTGGKETIPIMVTVEKCEKTAKNLTFFLKLSAF
jgi:hypothetical protein